MATGRHLVVGCGSCYAEDRLEAAVELAGSGRIQYMAMDCLAERTLVSAQLRRLQNASIGYDMRLEAIARELVPVCARQGVRLIGNFGAANPEAGAERMAHWCREEGLKGLRIACLTGDDVLDWVRRADPLVPETGTRVSGLPGRLVTANAYLGADGVVAALGERADVVITGRVADPSLFLAPAVHELGWSWTDWDRLAGGQAIGHVLECGTYITGGNYADPPYRPIPGLENLGMPMAEIYEDAEAIITKVAGAGGILTTNTVKSQLVYEIGDPARYITPDVAIDMREIRVEQVGPERVRLSGARGAERPAQLKVLLGMLQGYIGEGEVTFAGSGALDRARLGAEMVTRRIANQGLSVDGLRVDYIGLNSVFGKEPVLPPGWEPPEVRLRVAARCPDERTAQAIGQEVEWLFFGPSGAGGVRKGVRQILAMYATFLPRELAVPHVQIREV